MINKKKRIKNGSGRDENVEMDVWCDKVGQEKKYIYMRKFRYSEYSWEKARQQIEMVLTC